MDIEERKQTEGYFEQYWRYASALRNWWDKATELFWIDISVDVITFCSFFLATYKLIIALGRFG